MSESEKVIIISFVVILSCLYSVSPARQLLRNKHETFNPKDENWEWGPMTGPESNEVSANEKRGTRSDNNADYCSPYDPDKPNFNTPGRRISEIKCYEYIWELKNRHEIELRQEKCIKQRNAPYQANTFRGLVMAGVVGGTPTLPGEYPHMGAIGWSASTGTWVFKCGSTLISPKFVLTAGHCTQASDRDTTISDPVPKIVRLGDKNIIDVVSNGMPPTDEKIIKIISHPKYFPPKKYYDIALMELEKHVAFTKFIQPACLWSTFSTTDLGSVGNVTGWGVVETVGRKTSPELLSAMVDIIDTPSCDELLRPFCNRNWCGVRDNQICAGKLAGGVDACQDDSGGPLQVKIPLPVKSQGSMHYVVGVTSFGIGCALPNLPGIYSRVSMYLDWIEDIVWPDDK